jgi:hypothetical protein
MDHLEVVVEAKIMKDVKWFIHNVRIRHYAYLQNVPYKLKVA